MREQESDNERLQKERQELAFVTEPLLGGNRNLVQEYGGQIGLREKAWGQRFESRGASDGSDTALQNGLPVRGRVVVQVRENRFGVFAIEVAVSFFRGAVKGLLALVQHKNLVGDFQRFVAVGGQNNRVPEEGELLQVRAENLGVVGVKARKRFVENNQARISHEFFCQGDSAAFAATECANGVVEPRTQPEKFAELFQSPSRVALEILLGHSNPRTVQERFFNGQVAAQFRVLLQEGDVLADFFVAVIQLADAYKGILTALMLALQQAQKGRLALARTPNDGENFASV